MLGADSRALAARGAAYRMIGAVDNHLTVRTIKRLIDGALGAHGAWLLEPYADLPGSTGLNTESIEEMKATAAFAVENGFQVATHAIGDRANRETLDIYEEAFRAHPDKTDLRWRIEHAQHLDPADVPRFAKLGVIPAMQAIHCTSDAPWVFKRLGERGPPRAPTSGASSWTPARSIPIGTDVPVEPIDPMANFYAAVTRKLKDGTAFFPDQKMTREEALRAYTVNGAYAAFETGLKGSLAPGKLADITVLSRDILTCPEDDIPGTEVLYTIVGGKVLYRPIDGRSSEENSHVHPSRPIALASSSLPWSSPSGLRRGPGHSGRARPGQGQPLGIEPVRRLGQQRADRAGQVVLVVRLAEGRRPGIELRLRL